MNERMTYIEFIRKKQKKHQLANQISNYVLTLSAKTKHGRLPTVREFAEVYQTANRVSGIGVHPGAEKAYKWWNDLYEGRFPRKEYREGLSTEALGDIQKYLAIKMLYYKARKAKQNHDEYLRIMLSYSWDFKNQADLAKRWLALKKKERAREKWLKQLKPKPKPKPNATVSIRHVVGLSAFKKTMSLQNAMKQCRFEIAENYLDPWLFTEGHSHPVQIHHGEIHYWVAKGGYAAGCILDPVFFNGEKIFYLAIICTEKGGSGLGHDLRITVEHYAKTCLSCSKVWLSSVPHKTHMYLKWGYTFGPYCRDGERPYLPIIVKQTSVRDQRGGESRAAKRNRSGGIVRNAAGKPLAPPRPATFFVVYGLGGTRRNVDAVMHSRKEDSQQTRSNVHYDGVNDGYLMSKCL